ncbi:MAG: aminotransferase class V-fold PLP-dependent enzyme, partial [Gemmatimonadales bacterium]
VALTDSTTMGLGLLYGGLKIRQGQEILTTTHDHYSTEISLSLRAEKTGATVRRIPLYRDIAGVTAQELVDTLVKNVRQATRVVAVTWVHSSTGLKLPIRRLSEALERANAGRSEEDRALLCVDGVHGFGVEDATMQNLGCDFFIAGCHKWLFGPRGTGVVFGAPRAWPHARATIPTFDHGAYRMWMKEVADREIPLAAAMTPGGFHSFEHRWALGEAFRFHQAIGKARVARRIHELNRQLKEGLAAMKHVKLHTPMADELSAGIVCFEVRGVTPVQVVQRLLERRILASETPYATKYARLSPGLLNSPDEVKASLRAVRELA